MNLKDYEHHIPCSNSLDVVSYPIEVTNVWKKFQKGEYFDSLRDYIPRMTKRIFARNKNRDLEKREFWAVKDVSFRVKKGEALGIIGPNGSGKSTMLKLLSRILKPDRGGIKIEGRLSALIEVGAGFHQDLTGRENIFLNATILGMSRAEIKKKFEEIVEFSELSEFIDTPVKRYSSGMFARLGFSVAAHIDPDMLLIDEVLSVGDFMFQHKCLKRMAEIIGEGKTVIFVSHNIPQVIKLCSKTILLNKGSIEMVGDSRDVCRHFYRANANTRMIDGDEQLVVEELNCYDGKGRDTNAFVAGESARVNLRIGSRRRFDNLIMGFFVKQSDGMVVFDANSDKVGNRVFSFQEGGSSEVELEFRVNLPEGRFFMGVHFMNGDRKFCLYQDEILEFYVNAPKTMGCAFLDTKWK